MLSSLQQQAKYKSRSVSSFRDFPEGFDLIPKPNPDDLQDIFHLTKDDAFAAYPLLPNQDSVFPSDGLAGVDVKEAESFVGKMDLNSNDVDDVPKSKRVSADLDFPRFCGQGLVDVDGDGMAIDSPKTSESEKRVVVVGLMAASMCSSMEKKKNRVVRAIVELSKKKKKKKKRLVEASESDEDGDIFNRHSDIPGGSHVEMRSSKRKRRNLLQANVRSNVMDCAQGKQAYESMCSSKQKKKKNHGLEAIVESNTMDCPQEKQASESEERVKCNWSYGRCIRSSGKFHGSTTRKSARRLP